MGNPGVGVGNVGDVKTVVECVCPMLGGNVYAVVGCCEAVACDEEAEGSKRNDVDDPG